MKLMLGICLALALVTFGSYPRQTCSGDYSHYSIAHAFKVAGC